MKEEKRLDFWKKHGYKILECKICKLKIPSMSGLMQSHLESHKTSRKEYYKFLSKFLREKSDLNERRKNN
jgi:hypothetical protein